MYKCIHLQATLSHELSNTHTNSLQKKTTEKWIYSGGTNIVLIYKTIDEGHALVRQTVMEENTLHLMTLTSRCVLVLACDNMNADMVLLMGLSSPLHGRWGVSPAAVAQHFCHCNSIESSRGSSNS